MTLSKDNIVLSSLLYESLFILDGNLKAEPLLCDNWSTEDNVTFTFVVRPGISMSDGSLLDADDVAYSLRQAMFKGRYVNRLKSVSKIESDGDMTVTVVLYVANSRLINLLDIPIIKSGSIDSDSPPGTGPFFFAGPDEMRLDLFLGHRDSSRMPLRRIMLRECADNELTELFDDGDLSLLWDDPSDAFEIRLNRLHAQKYYETSTMQFIGFNSRKGIMKDSDVRRAVGYSVDRQYISENIMPQGQTLPSPTPLSPVFRPYDKAWEHPELDPQIEMTLLLMRAQLDDFDEDSFLELSDGADGYTKFSVDFIVNIENAHRVQAAHKISDTLRRIGFNIAVRELTWEKFVTALQTGDFDMYFGEIALGADFDLSPLLLPGGLGYGGTASSFYRPFIEDFLAAESDNDVHYAAGRLCEEVFLNAPFVPILYKRYAIYSPMGAITGAAPSQSGVFHKLSNWVIDLTMLT